MRADNNTKTLPIGDGLIAESHVGVS